MIPQEAWKAVLDQLRIEMPKASFEERVSGSRFLSYEDGVFKIAVNNDYSRDWLENRLTSTVVRMLIGMMNRNVQVYFKVQPPTDEELERSEDQVQGEEIETHRLQISELRLSLVDLFVKSNREIMIPGYLRRWIPYLGPSLFWILIGFRQIMYLKTSQEAEANQEFEAKGTEIIRWTGLSRSTFWKYMNDPRLEWFLMKSPASWTVDEKTGRTRQNANRYKFVATTPLTPGDADALHAWLVKAGASQDPVRAVQNALEADPTEIFPDPPPLPKTEHLNMVPKPQSIQNIVRITCAKMNQETHTRVTELANELTSHLMPRNDRIFVSWYFVQHWVSILGAAPATFVMLMRDRCFVSNEERRNEVWIQGGDAEIAQMLGLTRSKTVNEWLPPLFERPSSPPTDPRKLQRWERRRRRRQEKRDQVAKFLQRLGYRRGEECYAWQFQVTLDEPLVPKHQAIYDTLLDLIGVYLESGDRTTLNCLLSPEGETSVNARAPIGLSGKPQRRASDSLAKSTGVSRILDEQSKGAVWTLQKGSKGAIQTQTKARSGLNLKHLIKTTIGLKPLEEFLNHLDQLTTSTTTNNVDRAKEEEEVVVGGEWNFKKLLQLGGVEPEKIPSVSRSLSDNQPMGLRFIAWCLYAYANKTTRERPGIDAPILFAVSRYQKSEPDQDYLELGQKSPAQLAELMNSFYTPGLTGNQRQIIAALQSNGFSAVVESLCT